MVTVIEKPKNRIKSAKNESVFRDDEFDSLFLKAFNLAIETEKHIAKGISLSVAAYWLNKHTCYDEHDISALLSTNGKASDLIRQSRTWILAQNNNDYAVFYRTLSSLLNEVPLDAVVLSCEDYKTIQSDLVLKAKAQQICEWRKYNAYPTYFKLKKLIKKRIKIISKNPALSQKMELNEIHILFSFFTDCISGNLFLKDYFSKILPIFDSACLREVVCSKYRKRMYVELRYMFAYVAYHYFGFTYKATGRLINRHHSSIIHACMQIDNLIQFPMSHTDKVMKDFVLSMKYRSINDAYSSDCFIRKINNTYNKLCLQLSKIFSIPVETSKMCVYVSLMSESVLSEYEHLCIFGNVRSFTFKDFDVVRKVSNVLQVAT